MTTTTALLLAQLLGATSETMYVGAGVAGTVALLGAVKGVIYAAGKLGRSPADYEPRARRSEDPAAGSQSVAFWQREMEAASIRALGATIVPILNAQTKILESSESILRELATTNAAVAAYLTPRSNKRMKS